MGSLYIQELIVQAYSALYRDIWRDPSLHLSTKERECLEKDLHYVVKRIEKEGSVFACEKLPSFLKIFDRHISGSSPLRGLDFRSIGISFDDQSSLPKFGRLFFSEPLDSMRMPFFVKSLRQICLLFYKLDIPYPKEKEDKVINNFLQTERELVDLNCDYSPFISTASRLFTIVMDCVNFIDITPKHGPGAVSTGEKGFDKWNFKRKFKTTHVKYPYYSYYPEASIRSNGRAVALASSMNLYSKMEWVDSPTAKVVLVPKDSRGPRLISMEPLELQYLQQGLMKNIVHTIENHPLTKGNVNFTDQSVNQRLALHSSKSLHLATLDLKDASDRLTVKLLKTLYKSPNVDYLLALRSHSTTVNGENVPLCKYAPMGSALCFPVLALTVWAIARSAVAAGSRKVNDVFVYGDDLIIPTEDYDQVVTALHDANLKVNIEKSFRNGFFRESCGCDAYKGIDVTPIKIRKLPPKSTTQVEAIQSWISYTDRFTELGYFNLSEWAKALVIRVVGDLPTIPVDTGALSFRGDWCFPMGTLSRFGRNSKEVYLLTLKAVSKDYPLGDYSRLYLDLTVKMDSRPTTRTTGVYLHKKWLDFSSYLCYVDYIKYLVNI